MHRILLGVSLVVLLPLAAAAQKVPPDPCVHDPETGPTTAELRACSQWRYEEAAAALAQAVVEVRALLGDSAAAGRRKVFEGSQAAWLRYRAAACEAAYLEVFPGTFALIHRNDCLRRLTDERVVEMRRTYFPDP